MATINWFPGHMKKTKREIVENLKLVDAVIEIRDARIPRSSANPDIDKICAGKPRVILLNKSDLSESSVTKAWVKELSNENVRVLEVNCLRGQGLQQIKPALLDLLKEKHERAKAKGLVKFMMRVMVVGIPNVGKSTFINSYAGKACAKTGNKPGVTKGKQWIRLNKSVELLDTPGILWPKFEDQTVGLRLALIGSIKDEILNVDELAVELVKFLKAEYPGLLAQRYEVSEENDIIELISAVAVNRKCLSKGGEPDYSKAAALIIDDFRSGKLGNITLERPEKIIG